MTIYCQHDVELDPVVIERALDDRLLRVVERDLTDLAQKQVFYETVAASIARNDIGKKLEDASRKLYEAYRALLHVSESLWQLPIESPKEAEPK